jgi:putative membrane protein insertion efficiency factor
MTRLPGLLIIAVIKMYKYIISPILPMACRFTPTCSDYGIQAVRKHGAFKGTVLAMRRILRCNPWGGHGHDPVP